MCEAVKLIFKNANGVQASMRTLVLYESLSGNTSRLAAIIAEMLEDKGAAVTIQPLRNFLNLKKEEGLALIQDKQKILIGTYTDDTHEPPELVEELLEEYDLAHADVAAFGTGDTQWETGIVSLHVRSLVYTRVLTLSLKLNRCRQKMIL